jgi:hypothetical protein
VGCRSSFLTRNEPIIARFGFKPALQGLKPKLWKQLPLSSSAEPFS